MDTLQIAYEILNRLEHDDGTVRYKNQLISPDALNVAPGKWESVMKDLEKNGYISGLKTRHDILGNTEYDMKDIYITIAGCEYLKESGPFAKFRNLCSDVVTIAAKALL